MTFFFSSIGEGSDCSDMSTPAELTGYRCGATCLLEAANARPADVKPKRKVNQGRIAGRRTGAQEITCVSVGVTR